MRRAIEANAVSNNKNNIMDAALKLIKGRHSARVPFDAERKIPKRDLKKILEAGRWAPTPR